MKNSIKRAQSRAGSSFAERENFRPKVKHLKKSLLTLVALFAISTGAWAQTTVRYAIGYQDLNFTSGQTVEVKDGNDVVATITYGESGGNNFTILAGQNFDGYTYCTEGNGTNGNNTGGTFYTIVPVYDGTIDVAVILNANKAFYILENGVALEGYNGITVDTKTTTKYRFNVSAGKSYKFYAAGTKLSFFGFDYTYGTANAAAAGTALTPNATRKIWTLDKMPAGNVTLQVEYYPGMLVKPTNLVGGTMEIEGLTDTTLPEGFEKDDDGNIYVAKDTKFTVKAVPAEGYHLVGWSDDAENKELEREFTMGDDDFILTATFSDEYDLAFEALNANTIEDGKATVKVGDTDKTADIQDGKLTGVKYGQTVTLTATQGYKFRSVEAKKTGSAVLAPALENGATVVIICNWGYAKTTFTYTNNGGTFSGQASGHEADYFNNGLELNGKNLSFGAWNVDNSEFLSVGITFNTESSAYSYTGKGEDFVSFTISVNGTDVTDQLSELK